jgi:hypothetical protein
MDEEIEKRLAALEAKIADMKAEEAFHFDQIKKNFSIAHERMEDQRKTSHKIHELMWGEIKKLQEREEGSFALHKAAKDSSTAQHDMLHQVSRDISKLYDVYYHIFPERLKQDVQLQRQLDALKSKQNPGADPKEG